MVELDMSHAFDKVWDTDNQQLCSFCVKSFLFDLLIIISIDGHNSNFHSVNAAVPLYSLSDE